MLIRQEKEAEFAKIYDMVKVAFQTADVSNGKEQDLVENLRESENYISELALVAEENGEIIGHVMLTKLQIFDKDRKIDTLSLAPLSVVQAYRNKGVGTALIQEGLRLASEAGHKSVFLVGNPKYYHRFGFKSGSSFGISFAHDIPEELFMACELVPHALKGITGIVDC